MSYDGSLPLPCHCCSKRSRRPGSQLDGRSNPNSPASGTMGEPSPLLASSRLRGEEHYESMSPQHQLPPAALQVLGLQGGSEQLQQAAAAAQHNLLGASGVVPDSRAYALAIALQAAAGSSAGMDSGCTTHGAGSQTSDEGPRGQGAGSSRGQDEVFRGRAGTPLSHASGSDAAGGYSSSPGDPMRREVQQSRLRHAGRSREAWDSNGAVQGGRKQTQPIQSQPDGLPGATSAAGTGDALMAACQEYIRVRQQEGVRVPGVREEPEAVVSEEEEEGQEGVMAAVELRGTPQGTVTPEGKKGRAEVGRGPSSSAAFENREVALGHHLLGRMLAAGQQPGPTGAIGALDADAAASVKLGLLAAAAGGNPVLAAGLPGMGSIFEQMNPFQQHLLAIWQQQQMAAGTVGMAGRAGNGAGPQGPATPTSPFAGMPPLPM